MLVRNLTYPTGLNKKARKLINSKRKSDFRSSLIQKFMVSHHKDILGPYILRLKPVTVRAVGVQDLTST